MPRKKYRKRSGKLITAVQLNLATEGFSYRAWGDTQRCKPGDWLVENDGECYSIDADTFKNTYKQVSPGRYEKTTSIWAEVAGEPGEIKTREGTSHYQVGDYIVSNNEDGSDSWCIAAEKFVEMYEQTE